MAVASPKTLSKLKVGDFTSDKSSQAGHQRFVLPDHVALSYLEDDESVVVLDRTRTLEGYQCYVVEQWAVSRTHPTYCIASYTGDSSDTIKVGILSVSADESSWSPRLRVYFKTLQQYHAKRRETPLGTLMVTSLSGFPSTLTIVPIPGGDLRKHREDFVVNEDLKRLGCSGRAGLTLAEPTGATQAKFHQLYMTSERINLYESVIELVKLCQVALLLFRNLDQEYCDGLLCDVTEKAVNDWWTSIGMDLYNVEPSDGILGPTTVAALLGTLMGARNRLHAYGAPVAKDVFDIGATKRAIVYFQKNSRIPRTRRLDRYTLDQLHRATAKQASGDSWTVPRALKSTVAELSGKGGEMVMEMVGRNKGGIAEVETVDIERFVQLVSGERAKWLWHGKARKRTTRDIFNDASTEANGPVVDQNLAPVISQQPKPTSGESSPETKLTPVSSSTWPQVKSWQQNDADGDNLLKKTVFNRAKGRLKSVVGKPLPQDAEGQDPQSIYANEDPSRVSMGSFDTDDPGSPSFFKTFTKDRREIDSPDRTVAAPHSADDLLRPTRTHDVPSSPTLPMKIAAAARNSIKLGDPIPFVKGSTADAYGPAARANSVAPSTAYSTEGEDLGPTETKGSVFMSRNVDPHRILRRRHSYSKYESTYQKRRNDNFYPRRLSFSSGEEAVLHRRPIYEPSSSAADPLVDFPDANSLAEKLRALHVQTSANKYLLHRLSEVSVAATYTTRQISSIDSLSVLASQDADQLSSLLHPRREEYDTLAQNTRSMFADERSRLNEALRDVETASAKLEYEISGLKSKVEEVEDTVAEFERGVVFVEGRVAELVRSGSGDSASGEGWSAWLSRRLFGVGRRPAEKSV